MKIAGRKNDGAWYRFNKLIKKLQGAGEEDNQADLVNALKEIDSFPAYVLALQGIMEKAGFNGATALTELTVDALAETYGTKGIPRTVWQGLFSWDTYVPTGTGPGKVKPEHATEARVFANDLRTVVSHFFLARRLFNDVVNLRTKGNPGGIADATDAT